MDREWVLILSCILLMACTSLAVWFFIIAYIAGQVCP